MLKIKTFFTIYVYFKKLNLDFAQLSIAWRHFLTNDGFPIFNIDMNISDSSFSLFRNSSTMVFFKPAAILFVFLSSSGILYKTNNPLRILCVFLPIKEIKFYTTFGQPWTIEVAAKRAPIEANLSIVAVRVILLSSSLAKINYFSSLRESLESPCN